ncbi:MAG: ParB/RepB/Spo0J family partition protein [Planctomycetaceae bacterium]
MDEQQVLEMPRRRLGRGLSGMFGSGPSYETTESAHDSDLRQLATAQIARNPYQPRKEFDQEALSELAASIAEHGILQPLLVRALDGGFQLIAGERRWLAAQKVGLETVPCCVVDVVDKTACEFALEENLKRKDLSDLEKAQAFREYLSHFECSVEELAKQLSMSRSTVSNLMRLLDLPEAVRNVLQQGKISAGHARALLALQEADQLLLCGRIQAESLNVRQTEQAVKQILGKVPAPETTAGEGEQPQSSGEQAQGEQGAGPDVVPMADPNMTNHVRDLEQQLRNAMGTAVEIKLKSKSTGQIVIPFANNEEFERILGLLRERTAAVA